MSDPETLKVYATQTEAYATMMDREADRDPMIGRFLATIPPGGRVLDLGCGPGHYARRMAEAGLAVDAMDAVPEMVERAAAQPGVTAWLGRFDDLDPKARYDGIWAYFSLLHAPRTEIDTHLAAIARALKPGGTVFIAVKRGQGGGRDRLGRHYEYYERDELEQRLLRAGLTPIDHWQGQAVGLAGHPDGWIALHAHG